MVLSQNMPPSIKNIINKKKKKHEHVKHWPSGGAEYSKNLKNNGLPNINPYHDESAVLAPTIRWLRRQSRFR